MARGVGLRVRRAGAPQQQARGRGAARLARAKDGSHAARGIVVARGLKENLASLPAHEDVTLVTVKETGHTIKPGPGKMASVRIYAELEKLFGGKLDSTAAEWALGVYDEYVAEAKEVPGSHPNIDILLGVVEEGAEYTVVIDK
mmetsp:Transcript_7600/g.19496  ORF Transcript_7600/g.19496 Transcript_7600/m.19496 type:complete len:144 (-) Transcript_7600:26-457(-)